MVEMIGFLKTRHEEFRHKPTSNSIRITKRLIVAALASLLATPAFAAPEASVVMQYRLPDGSTKAMLFTVPEGLSLADCRASYKAQLPTFKRQVAEMNIPEFAGAEFVSAQCEPYSEDSLN
jgi:hypothetical protein